jgi:peptidoglycan/LPS O-acetylase OafA/YrhL
MFSYYTPPGRNTIPSLDGIRAISISFVLIAHSALLYWGDLPKPVWVVAYLLGPFGVVVFFVISGFLITSLLKEEQRKTNSISIKAFYRRRAVRILPAALVYIAIATCFSSVHVYPGQLAIVLSFATCYFYPQMPVVLMHFWSLSVEEQFYLLYPWCLRARWRLDKVACWAAVVIAPLARYYCHRRGLSEVSHYFPSVMDGLAVGCLFGLYREKISKAIRGSKTGYLALVSFVLSLLLAYWFDKYPLAGVWLGGVKATAIGLAIITSVEARILVLNLGFVTWIGRLSYSIYLWQQFFLLQYMAGAGGKHLALRLCAILLTSILSYYLIERPMLKFKAPFASGGRLPESEALAQSYEAGAPVETQALKVGFSE